MRMARCSRCGSVLMEFVIVLPIYLVLFGGIFMVGDISIHSIRLASADRTAAFDIQNEGANGFEMTRDIEFGRTNVIVRGLHEWGGLNTLRESADDNTDQNSLSFSSKSAWYASNVQCPWSVRVAATVVDNYKLPVGGTMGRLAAADYWLYSGTRQYGGRLHSEEDPSFFGRLVSNQRVAILSKDARWLIDHANARAGEIPYNYYTLRRRKHWTDDRSRTALKQTWRSNSLPASDLVVWRSGDMSKEHAWESEVATEGWHESDRRINDSETNRSTFDAVRPSGPVEYSRYSGFVDWNWRR